MRLVVQDEDSSRVSRLPVSAHTLLSGGAAGAEAEFGACAERWGLAEETFSFDGRTPERSRGLVSLTPLELKQGEVSSTYLHAKMHRDYPQTPLFRKILSSILYQVTSAGEVFSVGVLLPDNTVKGGTGWAAELAKLWEKPVHVFDQERHGWFAWRGGGWQPAKDPLITRTRFTGSGTRFLTDEGRGAIRGLFERSFGPLR
jgi:hypothetical protein